LPILFVSIQLIIFGADAWAIQYKFIVVNSQTTTFAFQKVV